MQYVYIEQEIIEYPRTQKILQRLGNVSIIECMHYGEVFNQKAQNFRIQKEKPALILAKKRNRRILPAPEGFGIDGHQSYYFSHMLNCLHDCRYCFLQGMYQSANYVLFVNYEDFMDDISILSQKNPHITLFTGYDCDSLAYEPVSQFLHNFLTFFKGLPKTTFELRTKSTNIKALLNTTPSQNVIVAFSFTPEIMNQTHEIKVPNVNKRIDALEKVARQGWPIGLRFDPLIWCEHFDQHYGQLIDDIFRVVEPEQIHSVSLGLIRFPAKMYHKLIKLYPEDKLLAHPLHKRDNYFSYTSQKEDQMKKVVADKLAQYLSQDKLFSCSPL